MREARRWGSDSWLRWRVVARLGGLTGGAALAALAGLAPLPLPLAAQTDEDRAAEAAAATLTTAALRQQMAMLTADSFWGRATPSPALQRAATYLEQKFADSIGTALQQQFQVLIAPLMADTMKQRDTAAMAAIKRVMAAGEDHMKQYERDIHAYLYSYPLPGRSVRLDLAQSQLNLGYMPQARGRAVWREEGGPVWRSLSLSFGADAYFAVRRVPEIRQGDIPPAVLLTGRPSAAFMAQADLAQYEVLYLPPADLDAVARQAILDSLYQASRGVVVLALDDSAHFAARRAAAQQAPLELVDAYLQYDAGNNDAPRPWVVEARLSPVLADILQNLGVDLGQARVAQTPEVRKFPGLSMALRQAFDTTDTIVARAPIVPMTLDGDDKVLKRQCLVLVVPLDQRRPYPTGAAADSAARWREPSTVSLAGALALIEAFRTLAVRPKRTLVLLATSGGAESQQFWGSNYYLRDMSSGGMGGSTTCVPVASLTLDLSVGGAMTGDTAVFAGLTEVKGMPLPTWAAAAHPDLGLTVVDGGSALRSRSDASTFGEHYVPSLVLQNGLEADDAPPSPGAGPPAGGRGAGVDMARAARLFRLAFYVSRAILDAKDRPEQRTIGKP